mgnify:CR=1 FL=1
MHEYNIKKMFYMIFYKKNSEMKLSANDRKFLIELYKEDILKTASLLGRDLSSWLK